MKKMIPLRPLLGAASLKAALVLFLTGTVHTTLAGPATVASDAIWVHDQLYGTIATDTAFSSPPPQSTDVIFSFMGSGLEGQRSVAEYAPGDVEYSGGRWNVMLVTFTDLGKMIHDGDGDGKVDFELTNAEAVVHHAELGHLTISEPGVYFECPLRPQPAR